jgi:ABC-type hemin transport system substrate-binding protein
MVTEAATPRIASLVPSLTDLVVALGLGPYLVARTGFCIHPAQAVADVAKVGGTKDVNIAKLRRLAPTHALVNVDENRAETAEVLRDFVAEVIVTHPCSPEDSLGLITQLASAFAAVPGVAERAIGLRRELELELHACERLALKAERVLYLIWREPWMTVARDTYISRMLAKVGWHTEPAQAGGPAGAARYPAFTAGAPWLERVDRVLLSSEPCAFTAADAAQAQALCPHARVGRVDGELLSWYGPRTAAGLRYLRELRAAG